MTSWESKASPSRSAWTSFIALSCSLFLMLEKMDSFHVSSISCGEDGDSSTTHHPRVWTRCFTLHAPSYSCSPCGQCCPPHWTSCYCPACPLVWSPAGRRAWAICHTVWRTCSILQCRSSTALCHPVDSTPAMKERQIKSWLTKTFSSINVKTLWADTLHADVIISNTNVISQWSCVVVKATTSSGLFSSIFDKYGPTLTACACLMKSRMSSLRAWWIFAGPLSSHKHTAWTSLWGEDGKQWSHPVDCLQQLATSGRGLGGTYENRSNHCCLVTDSCRSSFRTMGRIRSHLSSNWREPLFWEKKNMRQMSFVW